MKKQFKIWIFFEMVEKDLSTIFRGIATDKQTKEDFEKSLSDEMRLRKTKNWWIVEENLSNHLYGHEMYLPGYLARRNMKYRINNREVDGD